MWTLEKIQSYIDDKVEEDIHLDYKASGALQKTEGKRGEIGKDVSSFANSDGGIIIYGLKEFQVGTKYLAEKIDPIDRNIFSKETLEQSINSNVSPRIPNIKISTVSIPTAEHNQVVYVVEIPKSDTAHQAKDKRYYKRFNFLAEAMEDWEIKDIINRKSNTDLHLWLEPEFDKKTYKSIIKNKGIEIKYQIWLQNTGNKVAEFIEIYLSGESKDKHHFISKSLLEFDDQFEIPYSNEISHKINIQEEEFVVNIQRRPLLPRVSRVFGTVKINTDFIIASKELKIILVTEDSRKTIIRTIPKLVGW